MSALRDSSGVYHVVSDGIGSMSRSRLYALCDIMKCAKVAHSVLVVNWAPADVDEGAIPNCITCVAAVREAVEDP